jgi:hypothetical protein
MCTAAAFLSCAALDKMVGLMGVTSELEQAVSWSLQLPAFYPRTRMRHFPGKFQGTLLTVAGISPQLLQPHHMPFCARGRLLVTAVFSLREIAQPGAAPGYFGAKRFLGLPCLHPWIASKGGVTQWPRPSIPWTPPSHTCMAGGGLRRRPPWAR